VAAEAPGEAMTSPPAPFSEIRLVAFDCRDPEYTPDTLERRRLMMTRQDGVWLSQPLIDFGIQGEHCGTFIEPRWQAREISTQTHAVLTLLAGKRCSDDRRGRDVEVQLIVVAGDGAKPFMYAPITTGASHVEDCAVGTAKCTPSEHAVKLSSSFTTDGLVLDGATSWPAILRDKTGAIRGVGPDRIEQSSVGTYRFKRP
jgi:hypothetical protein